MSEEYNDSGEMLEAAAPVDFNDNETSQARQQVPLDALQAERAERQKLQDEVKMMRDHMSLLQSSQSQSRPQPKDEFADLSDDDVLTVKDFKRFMGSKEQKFDMSIKELRMTQKYNDYQDVVTRYLPEVLKQNPGLQQTLVASQDYELAYYLAKNSDSYKAQNKKTAKNADAQRIVENSMKAGSLSSVGETSPISNAKQYKRMSDDEFRKVAQQNLGYY